MLRGAVRCAAVGCGLWGVLAAYGFWASRAALAAGRQELETNRRTARELALSVRQKRAEVRRLTRVRTDSPDGAGSADFVAELASMAADAGVTLQVTHLDPAPSTAAPAQGGQGASGDGAWLAAPFDVTVDGAFAGMVDLANRLAASPRVMDITSMDFARAAVYPERREARLQLRIQGLVYGQRSAR